MKKIVLVLTLAMALMACGNKAQQATQEVVEINLPDGVVTLEALLANAEPQVDSVVVVKGGVTHTCKHSGRRCFLATTEGNETVRVEAKGEIGGFNKELTGKDIIVTGTLRELRKSVADIDKMEADLKAKVAEQSGTEDECDASRADISKMRVWMETNKKDYYPIYFIDGEKYEEIG